MTSGFEKYCHSCGELIHRDAEICPKCGVRQQAPYSYSPQFSSDTDLNNRWIAALILCVFVGPLGVHRFYTGHIGTGILMLITAGGCGIWWLVDLIIIATGSFKDSDGVVLKNA